VPGILEGASEGRHDEPLARQAAGLCRKAGADPDAIGMDRGGAAPGQERHDAAAVRLARPVSAINEAMTPA